MLGEWLKETLVDKRPMQVDVHATCMSGTSTSDSQCHSVVGGVDGVGWVLGRNVCYHIVFRCEGQCVVDVAQRHCKVRTSHCPECALSHGCDGSLHNVSYQ
jgi:hypothetical protein